MTWIERTAYPRLPRAVSLKELRESFTPGDDEMAWARTHTQPDRHLLALVVRLKCYQRLGYFPPAAAIPAAVIDHVRAMLGLDAGVTAGYDVGRTGTRHRGYVRARVGAVREPARARAVAETAMREALPGKDNPADVINVALEALAAAGCELPGYSTLDEMAATLRAEVNGGFCHLVARLDAADRARLAALLVVDPASRQSTLPALTRPAPRATVSRLKQHVAHLRWLDGLGETGAWLQGVPAAKIAHFAGEAAVLDADALAEVGDDKRLTLLACLVHTARRRARDEVVTMFCKRMAAITKKARDKLEELREGHRAESERLLGVLGDVLADVREALGPPGPAGGGDDDAAGGLAADVAGTAGEDVEPIGAVCERAGRMVLKTLTGAGGVVALSTAHETVSAHHGNNPMPLMERYYRSHRAALFALLEVLELEATSTDRRVIDAVEVLRADRHRVGEYLPGYHQGQLIGTSFAGEAWQATLRDRRHPTRLRRRQFEVCVFAHLAVELRSGDVAVAGSESYANLHTQLMSWAECEPLVAGYCAQAGIAPTAGQAIAGWKAELTAAAAAVDEGYPGNADLVIADGKPALKRRTGTERRASALALESVRCMTSCPNAACWRSWPAPPTRSAGPGISARHRARTRSCPTRWAAT